MNVSYNVFGVGPAVLFLHGVGSGKDGWKRQLDTVLDTGFQFVALDAPGFGQTPLPTAPGFAPHVDAVLQVMDHLEIDRVVLCGHSLGGMTAQEFYAQHPDRVKGLVLSATSPAFGRPDGDFQKEFLRARFEPFDQGMTMPAFARTFASKLTGPRPAEDVIEEIVDVMSEVPVATYRLAMQTITGFDQRSNLAAIDVPTMLIAGEVDTNAPAPMMAKMASKIASADYVELPETGHMAPIENAAAFNQSLRDFLKRAV